MLSEITLLEIVSQIAMSARGRGRGQIRGSHLGPPKWPPGIALKYRKNFTVTPAESNEVPEIDLEKIRDQVSSKNVSTSSINYRRKITEDIISEIV